MKPFSLGNEMLNRLPIFGRTFITVSTKGLVCPKFDISTKGKCIIFTHQD